MGLIPSFRPPACYFGNIPSVKNNFTLVILMIILISVAPTVIEVLRQRRQRKRAAP